MIVTFIAAQAVLAGVVLLLLLFIGMHYALSALLAAIICMIANTILAYCLFREMRAKSAKRIIVNFCVGECLKLVVVVIAMLLAITYLRVAILPFLATYLLLQFSLLFVPFLLTSRRMEERV